MVLNKNSTQRTLPLRDQDVRMDVSWAFTEILEKGLDFHSPL